MAEVLAQLECWRRAALPDVVDAELLEAVRGACLDLATACAMKMERSRLLMLPLELLLHVLRYCNAADLAALDSTTKAFHSPRSIVELAIAGATEQAHGKLVAEHVLVRKKSAPTRLRQLEHARHESYDWARNAVRRKAESVRASLDPSVENVPEGLYPEGEPDHALAILLTATRAPFRKPHYSSDREHFPTPEKTHECVVSAILTLEQPPEAAIRWLSEVALHRPEANRAHTINAMMTLAKQLCGGEHEELLVRALWRAATSEENNDPVASVQWGLRLGAMLLAKTRELRYLAGSGNNTEIAEAKAERDAARPGFAIETANVLRRVLLVQRHLPGTGTVTVKPPNFSARDWTLLDTLLELVEALVHTNGVEAMQVLREALDTFTSDHRKLDEHPRCRAGYRLRQQGKAVVRSLAQLGRYADAEALLNMLGHSKALSSDSDEDDRTARCELSLREVRVRHLLLPQGLLQEAEELMLQVVALRRAALKPTAALDDDFYDEDEHGPLARAMILLAHVCDEQGKTEERAALGAELVTYYHQTVVGIRGIHAWASHNGSRVVPPNIFHHGGGGVIWVEEQNWKSSRLAAEKLLTKEEVATMAIELQATRLARQREELGVMDLQVVQSTGLQAYLMVRGGKLAGATRLVEETVEQLVACVGTHGFDLQEPTLVSASSDRMTLHHAVKDMSRALRCLYVQQNLWQRIKELEETVYKELCASCGADDKRTLDRLSTLLHACRESGNLDDGIAAGLNLVAALRAARGGKESDNRYDLGRALMLLGTVYRADQQLDAAEECLREMVEIGQADADDSNSMSGLLDRIRILGRQLLAECQSASGKHEVARRTQRSALVLVTDHKHGHTGNRKRDRSSIDEEECELMLGLARILWRHVDSLEQSEEAADRETSAERAAEACSLVRRVLAADLGYDRAPVVRKMLKRMGEEEEEAEEEEKWWTGVEEDYDEWDGEEQEIDSQGSHIYHNDQEN